MSRRIVRSFLSGGVMTIVCFCFSVAEVNHGESSSIKVLVENVNRVGVDKVDFRVKLVNGSSSSIFLESGPLLLEAPEGALSAEQLYLEQWGADGWRTIVPCLENAAASVFRLGPGKRIGQERELTNPVNAPCKERHIQFEGRFRFRLDYFLTEEEARTNEGNFHSSEVPVPVPHVAVSDPFEIPPLGK